MDTLEIIDRLKELKGARILDGFLGESETEIKLITSKGIFLIYTEGDFISVDKGDRSISEQGEEDV